MGMSFVPQMQNYFGKNTDFTKLSSAYGDSNAFGVQADMQGDLIREQAKNRAEMRLMAGEHALSQGQQAGSAATTDGFISGIGSAAGGFFGSDMAKNMFKGSTTAPSFNNASIPSSAWSDGIGVGGYNPTEIFQMPNIGYNPFG